MPHDGSDLQQFLLSTHLSVFELFDITHINLLVNFISNMVGAILQNINSQLGV